MNYYSFHIGDFVAATVHLSAMEELAYRRLLDMYYDTEQPIPLETERVSRRLRLDNETVVSVLSEFFERTDAGWRNSRCDREIAEYQRKANVARQNGKSGGRPKKTQSVTDRNQEKSGSKANQEPITKNQEPVLKPITSEHSPDAPPKKKSGSPEDHEAARWIYSVILKIDPTAKEPNWNSWANDIRLMREIDGRDHRSVCEMFDWASRHHFWCKNILSPGKLREKWGTLAVQRNGPDRSPPAARSAMNRIGIDSQTPEGWGDGSDI